MMFSANLASTLEGFPAMELIAGRFMSPSASQSPLFNGHFRNLNWRYLPYSVVNIPGIPSEFFLGDSASGGSNHSWSKGSKGLCGTCFSNMSNHVERPADAAGYGCHGESMYHQWLWMRNFTCKKKVMDYYFNHLHY